MLTPTDREATLEALLFRNLPDDLADALISDADVVRHGRGETIFRESDPASWVFVVLEGWVKLYRLKANGGESVVGVFTRGGSLGEAVAVQSAPYPVSASAVTACRLLRVRAARIVDLMTERPEMTRAIFASIVQHLHGLVVQIEQLKAQSGPQRVAEFLVSLAPACEGACSVDLPYDKSLIAARLGMQPESLSRTFVRLRKQGVEISRNNASIADIAALRAFSEEDRAATWSKTE